MDLLSILYCSDSNQQKAINFFKLVFLQISPDPKFEIYWKNEQIRDKFFQLLDLSCAYLVSLFLETNLKLVSNSELLVKHML